MKIYCSRKSNNDASQFIGKDIWVKANIYEYALDDDSHEIIRRRSYDCSYVRFLDFDSGDYTVNELNDYVVDQGIPIDINQATLNNFLHRTWEFPKIAIEVVSPLECYSTDEIFNVKD